MDRQQKLASLLKAVQESCEETCQEKELAPAAFIASGEADVTPLDLRDLHPRKYPFLLRAACKELDAWGFVFCTEAWATSVRSKEEARKYRRGDAKKSPERSEIIMITWECERRSGTSSATLTGKLPNRKMSPWENGDLVHGESSLGHILPGSAGE